MSHTTDIKYTRWERLVFRFTGRWPESVVIKRLDAHDADVREMKARVERDGIAALYGDLGIEAEDEEADHLTGSEFLDTIVPTSKARARERTIRLIKSHGPDSATASPTLVQSAEALFGSWTNALNAAGLGLTRTTPVDSRGAFS